MFTCGDLIAVESGDVTKDVSLGTESEGGISFTTKNTSWGGATADKSLYSEAYDWNSYAQYKEVKADETTITFDLTKVKDAGDAYAFGIKYNGWVDPSTLSSSDVAVAKAKKATITIKSIKLIPAK